MDYRYLVETKNEFNNFLCGILVPHIYHGIKGMLKYSDNVFNQIELKNKKSSQKINNPGIVNIFKKTLDGIANLNNHEIEEEYLRIKNASGCVDWFDNMVRASFKSYVLFLTWDPKLSNSKYSDNSIYESIVIKDFIHKCYVISCNYFKENPELFISKNSKKEVFDILKMCIEMSIKKSLPYNQIIEEYLNIEFDKTNDVNSREIQNIKSMVYNMMNDGKYGSRPQINNLIVDTGNDEFVNLEDSEFKKIQLENFINQEKIKEQNKLNHLRNSDNVQKGGNTTSTTSDNLLDSSSSLSESENNSNKDASNQTTTNINKSGEDITHSNTSNTLLSRDELKKKELEEILNPNKNSSSSTSTSSLTSKTSNKPNNKSESVQESGTVSKSDTNSKTSITNIITSPPIIRQKKDDRINDIFELGKKVGGGKKQIKVTRVKNNMMSDKFDLAENFYDNMIKKTK
jgi:hypothetical protein